MPRLTFCSAVWILVFIFRFAVAESKTHAEQNTLLSNPGEHKPTHDCSGITWKQRLLRGDKSLETVASAFPNKILQLKAAKNTDLERRCRNASASRTLIDFSGPVITEDLDDTSSQGPVDHIRIKRSEPVHRRANFLKLLDSFPRTFQTDATSTFSDSTSERSYSNLENQFDIVVDSVTPRSRRKRKVSLQNKYLKKRVKGNAGHSKNRVGIRKQKKHDALRSSHQSAKKESSNSKSRRRNKNAREIRMVTKTFEESRIGKREASNDLNVSINTAYIDEADLINQKEKASLIYNTSLFEQQKNTLTLPFAETRRSKPRVRIEKLPVNKSSFINPNYWAKRSVEMSLSSTVLPKFNENDEIFYPNAADLELTPNFDSVEGTKTDETMLKKLNQEDNTSVPESNSKNISFYNMEFYPVTSNVLAMKNDKNMENKKYNSTNEISVDLDDKLRVKRNQEITFKHYLKKKNTTNSEHLKNPVQETSIKNRRRGKARYEKTRGNRAVRSIEEIKNLAEKLIAKINELQVYINNRNKTLDTKNSSKDAGSAPSQKVFDEEPRISLKKKNVLSSAFRIGKINNRQRFAKEAPLAGKRTSQTHSSNSTLPRGEYQTGKKSRSKWGRWMDWSSCSVTCGKGRQIRWRHCLYDCNDAETEMEEKACQLPACPPNKFLGIF
ncbi:hypothetical protein PUN28_014338 [Cardiocondyla obscurior]|uniref:Uncharacterized protein n=1 Tax=Cardiocondyla obscurior TaxID=286306 RepID=A0AAW2F2U3_9HYME